MRKLNEFAQAFILDFVHMTT